MAAGVVHDVNNILQPVVGALDLVAEDTLCDPETRSMVLLGSRALSRGVGLLRSILTFARKEPPARTALRPSAVLQDAATLLRHVVRTRVTVTVDAPHDTWPVVADPRRLESALFNLALNARDAMPEGGSLDISTRNVGRAAPRAPGLPDFEYVVFSVRDTGAGMPPDVLARATEPFYTTKSAGKGSGLGLAMVSSFAAESGGHLHIESAEGRGTLVSIYLPRAPGDVTVPGQSREKSERRAASRERLMTRVRGTMLRDALGAWLTTVEEERLPSLLDMLPKLGPEIDNLFIVTVEPGDGSDPDLRFAVVGEALRTTVIGHFDPSLVGSPSRVAGSQLAAYQRAVRTRAPSYEYARYALGDGPPLLFERLLLPASDDDRNVTHLLGVVQFSTERSAAPRKDLS